MNYRYINNIDLTLYPFVKQKGFYGKASSWNVRTPYTVFSKYCGTYSIKTPRIFLMRVARWIDLGNSKTCRISFMSNTNRLQRVNLSQLWREIRKIICTNNGQQVRDHRIVLREVGEEIKNHTRVKYGDWRRIRTTPA